MVETLDDVEVRILGALIEKQRTTPEYYPLTLNALTNSCNQLSNREPVVSYDEKTVVRGLDSLREKKLVWVVSAAGSRAPKYEQRLTEALELKDPEIAVMCLLLLRGPQTPGELRSRSGRLLEFQDLAQVEQTLQGLADRPTPLVRSLPRQPGAREARYAHLLAGEPKWTAPVREVRPEAATLEVRWEDERLVTLERRVGELTTEVAELRKQLEEFRKQFE
jgi:uncharacterized protein YceH (UPF0502 family)